MAISKKLLDRMHFEFRCDKHWDELSETDNPAKRHCSQCERKVLYCNNGHELKKAVNAGECVAFEPPEFHATGAEMLRTFTSVGVMIKVPAELEAVEIDDVQLRKKLS